MDEMANPDPEFDCEETRVELRRMSDIELRRFGRLCMEEAARRPNDRNNSQKLELARKEFGRRQKEKSGRK